MDFRAILKVILHWYLPKVISETIKGGGGPAFMGGCVSRESSLKIINTFVHPSLLSWRTVHSGTFEPTFFHFAL